MTSSEQPVAKVVDLDAPPIFRLSDDILGEIFLRLPKLEDVARAATACPTFHRVKAGRAFLRRLRSVHPACILGFLPSSCGKFCFYPAEAPHPSAPCARARVRAADFSFSFVPSGTSPGPWLIRDVRDGRVLLEKPMAGGDFAVADPVSRRYALLPRPPIPSTWPIITALLEQSGGLHLETCLVPASGDEEPTSFRGICMAVSRDRLTAFVFSSADGGWRSFPFQDWIPFSAGNSGAQLHFTVSWRYCVDGCLFWRLANANKLIVLDMRRMEFSLEKIPPDSFPEFRSAIAEAWNGRPEMLTLRYNDPLRYNGSARGRSASILSSRRSDTGGARAWQPSNEVKVELGRSGLPSHESLIMAGAAGRHLLLQGRDAEFLYYLDPTTIERYVGYGYFSLDVPTMKLEKVCMLKDWFHHVNLYTGFPPSLSHPSL